MLVKGNGQQSHDNITLTLIYAATYKMANDHYFQ